MISNANSRSWLPAVDSNWKGYRNARVTNLLRRSDAALDVRTRMALVNQADALMANDLPTIPLYQKPTFLVYKANVKGMSDNTTQEGPMWNAQDWWLAK